ncbi:hypothetical protein N7455_003689 [Penicillium solitum]|uniref:uncharacterized protein n=1 Tax=Penicillium solitum TaxID=60172 RepID=UPI0032C46365|nr:hypothetical protein N7455_003689 [Penicillium solitum]
MGVSLSSHPHTAPDAASLATHNHVARKCGHKVGEVKEKRRALRRRDFSIDPGTKETIYEIHALAPKYNFVKNSTSILTPETSNGPYFYPQSQILRQDIREGQPGLPLSLEIGVIDIDTCEPLEDVLVDIWHCNATGSYSSFTGLSPNTPFLDLYANKTDGKTINLHDGLPDLSWLATDNSTWLRGMWPTDKHGVTSFTTIFPGFYIERAIHIHAQVHTNWTVGSNGTVIHGPIVSTGQIFIDEALEKQIMALEPYVNHTEIERVKNDADGIYTTESDTGAMTILDTEPLDGVNYENGVFGYITLGIQTSQIRNGSGIDARLWQYKLPREFRAKNIPPAIASFVRERAHEVKTVFTTCTGGLFVSMLGLLDGLNATTNHEAIAIAREFAPNVKWTAEKNWVVDGKFWTASGACAGMDMMAHWVMENYDKDIAEAGFAALAYEPCDVNGKQVVLTKHASK